jgi:hypothetical protein
VLGGVLGAGGLLGLEVLLAGAVAATLWMSAPLEAPPTAQAAALAPRAAPTAQAAAAAPAEEPGEVQVLTMAAVQVSLDGAPMVFDPAQGYLASAAPGRHRLQVTDMLGRITADTEVEVRSGRRAQLRYAKGALTDQGAMPRPGTSTPAAASEAQPVAIEISAPAPVAVEADLALELTGSEEPRLTLGAGPQAVEIKLPKIGLGRR